MLSQFVSAARSSRAPLQRCSQCIASSSRLPARSLATSSSRSKPAAARLAEVEDAESGLENDDQPSLLYRHSPPRRSLNEPQRLSGSMPFAFPNRPNAPLQLPTPLPMDVIPDIDSTHATLYPSTGVIDNISTISICLRRPDQVPRAYLIFRQLLQDSKTGVRRMPDTEIWAKVVQGMASLGKEPDASVQEEGQQSGRHRARSSAGGSDAAKWRDRTRSVIDAWESAFKGTSRGELPGREREGIKVYQGWFAGMVESGTPLDPLAPYLFDRVFTISDLLSSIKPADLTTAYEALTRLAESDPELGFIAEELAALQDMRQAEQEMMAREVIPEVKPVLESEGRNLLTKKREEADAQAAGVGESDMSLDGEGSDARFAVRNLRSTLEKLQDIKRHPRERQMELEHASYEAAKEELAYSAELLSQQKTAASAQEDQKLQRQKLQGWMYQWLGQLKTQLSDDIFALRSKLDSTAAEGLDLDKDKHTFTDLGWGSTGMKDNALALYLTLLPVDKLAIITVIEIMRQCGGHGVADGMKALRAMLAVGKAVETEYRAETIRSVAGVDSAHWQRTLDPQTQKPSQLLVGKVWKKLGKQVDPSSAAGQPSKVGAGRQEWTDWKASEKAAAQALEKTQEDDLKAVWTPPWSQMAHLGVGSFLVQRLLQTAKVERTAFDPETDEEVHEEQPAFSHGYDYVRGKKLGVIRLNPVVAKRLSKDNISTMIHPKHLPMLVEPRPWRKYNDGGYLVHHVPIMRFKDSPEQKSYLKEASDQGHLEPVFHGLDVLSSTPWSINRKVFDIVLEAWNSGNAIADIPAAESHSNYELPDRPDGTDPQARAHYVEKAKLALAQSRKDHAERCKYNYNIEIARSFLHETFYLPHSMDFRGRAYPIPPHLSPVGDDLCRGLLTFGVARPLGKTGLKWLQIHLANLYGFDKASFEDRARFAQDHEADIFDSADRPLEGNRWWLKAEDPWQCLATCFDLAAALRSPNPELYESSLPVHQDGTCNGMQHYAALGGDVRGARAVNLENGDRPADIYTGVADIVNKIIDQDKAEGHPVAALIPSALGRKVVKQTVMTTVYGVTFIGARDQIARQLQARGDVPSEHIFAVSAYVAKTVLSCIGDLFSGAKDIMDWLTTSARLVARSIPPERVEQAVEQLQGSRPSSASAAAKQPKRRLEKELMTSVIWTTPLGLPVVQPYRKAAKKQVMTALQSVYIADPNAPAEVSPQKQATAFPPNFIHSLDATHMLLTAYQCKQSGMTFSSVHDSYWTHAATVEPMSDTIRDMFIRLHSGDLIGELRAEFINRYGDYRIAVDSAKKISTSAKQRREKDAVRRKALATLLGEEESSAVVEQAMDGDEGATDVIRVMDAKGSHEELDETTEGSALEEEVAEAMRAAEGEVASESEAVSGSGLDANANESSGEGEGVDAPKRGKKPPSIALSQADLASLRKRRDDNSAISEEVINNQRFVKFKDVIPPCPPRGAFDVTRVQDSAYFFS